jgi:hypothetical protein
MQTAPKPAPNPITKRKILAVEGPVDGCFFNALFRNLRLRGQIQIVQMYGKDKLADRIDLITKTSGFQNVTDFGIAIDADSNYAGRFHSICYALRQSSLPVPAAPLVKAQGRPNVTVYTLPRTNTNGMLEDLLLSSVRNDPAIPCIDAYFLCLNGQGVIPKHMSKARAHAFLASRREPDLNCGNATNAKYWILSDAVFDEVKAFVLSL